MLGYVQRRYQLLERGRPGFRDTSFSMTDSMMLAWVMQYKDSRQLLQLYDSRATNQCFRKTDTLP